MSYLNNQENRKCNSERNYLIYNEEEDCNTNTNESNNNSVNDYVYVPYYKVKQYQKELNQQESNKKGEIKENLMKINTELTELKKNIDYKGNNRHLSPLNYRNNNGLFYTYENIKKSPSYFNTFNKTSFLKDKSYNPTLNYKNDCLTSGNINDKINKDKKNLNSNNVNNSNLVLSHFCIELLGQENSNVNKLLQTIHDQENTINNLRNNILHLEEKLKILEKEKESSIKTNFPIKGILIPQDNNQYLTHKTNNISLKNYNNKHSLFLNETYENEQQYSNNNTQEINQTETNNIINREHCQTYRNNNDMFNTDSLIEQRFKTEPIIQETNIPKATLPLQQKTIIKEQPLNLPFKLHFNYADYINGKPFTTLINTENSN